MILKMTCVGLHVLLSQICHIYMTLKTILRQAYVLSSSQVFDMYLNLENPQSGIVFYRSQNSDINLVPKKAN